jgi:hypothetical protein
MLLTIILIILKNHINLFLSVGMKIIEKHL